MALAGLSSQLFLIIDLAKINLRDQKGLLYSSEPLKIRPQHWSFDHYCNKYIGRQKSQPADICLLAQDTKKSRHQAR